MPSPDLWKEREKLSRDHDNANLLRYAGTFGGIRAVVLTLHDKQGTSAERAVEMIREGILTHEQEADAAYQAYWARFMELTERINAEHDALKAQVAAYEAARGAGGSDA